MKNSNQNPQNTIVFDKKNTQSVNAASTQSANDALFFFILASTGFAKERAEKRNPAQASFDEQQCRTVLEKELADRTGYSTPRNAGRTEVQRGKKIHGLQFSIK